MKKNKEKEVDNQPPAEPPMIITGTEDKSWKIIYAELSKDFPPEAIRRTKKEETKKGYDTTGIRIQYLFNRLNDVVGVDNWNYTYDILDIRETTTRNGFVMISISIKTLVEICGHTKMGVGGHKGADYFDTLKGAISNSLKKTFAFFGLGRQTYEGSIDDDDLPFPVAKNAVKTTTQSQTPPPANQSLNTDKICPVHKTPMRQGTTKNNTPYWYCPQRLPDGFFCPQRIWGNKSNQPTQSNQQINMMDTPFDY